jgi:hypothetical protein
MAEKKAAKKTGVKKASSAKKAAPAKKVAGAKKATAKKAASSAKAATSAKRRPTHDEIAERAYYISEREGGTPDDNWLRAERELSE